MTTNITDLPGGNSNQPNIQLHTKDKQNVPTDKIPLNSINEMVNGLQKAASKNMTRLPPRDIPANPERITQDPQIQPNFVPPPQNENYIENEMNYENMMRRNNSEVNSKVSMDSLYDQIQTPIIVGVLFFLFQLPFVNKGLFKFLPSLFKDDGYPNFSGYLFKTMLFSLVFFGVTKGFDVLSAF